MNDNMIKQSLRLFARAIMLILRIIVTPAMMLVALLITVSVLTMLVNAWAMNDEKRFNFQMKEFNDTVDATIKWFSI